MRSIITAVREDKTPDPPCHKQFLHAIQGCRLQVHPQTLDPLFLIESSFAAVVVANPPDPLSEKIPFQTLGFTNRLAPGLPKCRCSKKKKKVQTRQEANFCELFLVQEGACLTSISRRWVGGWVPNFPCGILWLRSLLKGFLKA